MLPRFFAACPLCGIDDHTPFVQHPELVFGRCHGCGLVFKTHAGAEHANDAWYDGERGSGDPDYRSRRFRHRVAKAKRQIRAGLHFSKAGSLLDIGCSHGYAMQAAKELGLEAHGVDVSREVVATCKARGYDVHEASLDALPFADGAFDLVLLKHVLEHAADPARALAELRRVIKPGGGAVIAVPDIRYNRLARHPEKRRGFDPKRTGREHHVYYDEDTLAAMLRKHGFVVRARSKATVLAPTHLIDRLWEPLRFAGVWLWQLAARGLRMRRELFFVALRS